MIEVQLNGSPHRIAAPATIGSLVTALGLDVTKLAVEHNRAIVAKSQYQATPLNSGDQIEIVHFVGGG